MNEQAREVFLCPDCGGPSMATGSGEAACSDCQKCFPIPQGKVRKEQARLSSMPTGKVGAIQRNIVLKSKGKIRDFGQLEKIEEPLPASADIKQQQKEHGKRRKRIKRRSKPPARVYFGWFVLWLSAVTLILVVISRLQNQFSRGNERALTIEERLVGEEREFYEREFPRIASQFNGFVRSRGTSQMSEYVMRSNQLERRMTRHFKGHTPRRPTLGMKPNPVFWNVAFEESPGFVEVVWDGKESGFFEGVFVKVDDSWVLDWEQFARYSSESWTLFHKKIGSQRSGIFRVYVEKVSEGEDKGAGFEPWMKLKILPPYVDERRRELEASETIQLEGSEGLAADFTRVFSDLSGRSEGFSQLWSRDPDGLRRVTVELEWVGDPALGEEKMVIKNLLAENWRTLRKDAEHLAPQKEIKESTDDE